MFEQNYSCLPAFDFTRVKNKLLLEYIRDGGRDTKAFLEGMTYLQDYIESGRDEMPLNCFVPEEAVTTVLKRQLQDREETIKELEKKIRLKNQALKNFRSMTKDERRALRKEEAYRDIEKKYSETRSQLVQVKNLSNSENL